VRIAGLGRVVWASVVGDAVVGDCGGGVGDANFWGGNSLFGGHTQDTTPSMPECQS
jgi:hypothetical protein